MQERSLKKYVPEFRTEEGFVDRDMVGEDSISNDAGIKFAGVAASLKAGPSSI